MSSAAAAAARRTVSEVSPLRFRPSALLLCCLLLVVSSVAWRKGAYFSGGADVVVLVKAGLTSLAVVIAMAMPRPPDAWTRFRAAPVFWLVAYLGITVVGGLLNGDGFSSFVLAARVGLVAVALLFLSLSHPWTAVLSSLTSAMVLVALVGAVTGVSSLAETGRLYGGIPPLNANEICLLLSVPVVLLFWKTLHGAARNLDYLALGPFVITIWLTGARTGLAALVVALMIMALLTQRLSTPIAVGLMVAIPATLYATFLTPWVSQFASRGDSSNVMSLNSRTVAWQAALNYAETTSEHLFGGGLALKQIPVTAAYRSQQILDSTWISAWIQAGILGTAVLVLYVVSTLVRGVLLPPPQRHLVVALTVMVTIVSVLESGMFDATPAFILFFTLALLARRVQPDQPHLRVERAEPGRATGASTEHPPLRPVPDLPVGPR